MLLPVIIIIVTIAVIIIVIVIFTTTATRIVTVVMTPRRWWAHGVHRAAAACASVRRSTHPSSIVSVRSTNHGVGICNDALTGKHDQRECWRTNAD